MQVALADGAAIGGEFVLRAVQRFDLTPIPSTLELMLRIDASDGQLGRQLSEGATLRAGLEGDRYRIIKRRRAASAWVQGPEGPIDALEVTAILESCAPLALRRERAVLKEGRTMGEVYRSCGATARVAADIAVARFSCFAGQLPTVSIAQALQEEGAVTVWRKGGELAFTRLPDLFSGRPVDALERDTTLSVESEYLEDVEVPAAFSVAPNGSVLLGRREAPRSWVFLPRTSGRVLDNLTRCLVVRRTVTGSYGAHVRAGDGIDVGGVRHVVATAAHVWDAGSVGGALEQSTRLWLAQLKR